MWPGLFQNRPINHKEWQLVGREKRAGALAGWHGIEKRQKEKEKSLNLSLPLCGVGVSLKQPDQAELNKANIKKPVHRPGHLSKTQLDKGSEKSTALSVLFGILHW